ncbi:19143_t:CDS:2, partial [Racocetra fulgida]
FKILIDFTNELLKLEQYAQTSSTISKITSNTTSASTPRSDLGEAIAAVIEGFGYVKKLQSDCEKLQEKLDRYTLSVDSSFLDVLEREHPDAIALWNQLFRPTDLSILSIAPYELEDIPIAIRCSTVSDERRKNGSKYLIKLNGTLCLKDIRPLWLPALLEALDPSHRGYVNPHDFLSFVGKEKALSNRLKQVIFDSCGYGAFV